MQTSLRIHSDLKITQLHRRRRYGTDHLLGQKGFSRTTFFFFGGGGGGGQICLFGLVKKQTPVLMTAMMIKDYRLE